MVRSLHHMAFRCRDTEETRVFYEEVIGLDFAAALRFGRTKSGRSVEALHAFFRMNDGAFIAFFEVPSAPFDFSTQHDFDLHLALETDAADAERAYAVARARGLEARGPSDHGFIRSYYLRDPNGYVVELSVRAPDHDAVLADAETRARGILADWTRDKAAAAEPDV